MKDVSRILQTVLVVEDDESFRTMLVAALQRRGYDALGADSGEAAIELAQQDSPEMAVVDLRLPGMSGLDVVRDLKRIDPATAVVVLTGYGSIATALEAIRLGAVHYLTKPTDADRVLEALGGVEYNGGCWVFRAVFQRIQAATDLSSKVFMFQLEFNGFGQIGSNETVNLFRRNVPGYSVTNPSDQSLVPPSARSRLPFEQVF